MDEPNAFDKREAAPPKNMVSLVTYIVMLPMLFSAEAKAWRPEPTRRSGTRT